MQPRLNYELIKMFCPQARFGLHNNDSWGRKNMKERGGREREWGGRGRDRETGQQPPL